MPKLSVIIPVYNVEKYIAATVQSVLDQTFQDFELLIIDDESPDQSVEICQQFKDPRIKIIHQKNRGLGGARNKGIHQAQGDYIAFLDGDDKWLPQMIEKNIKYLEKHPDVGVSFNRSAFIDEQGDSLSTYQMPKLKDITPSYLLRTNPIGNGSAAVFRREVLNAIKFQDNLYGVEEDFYFDDRFRLSQDIECWLRIAIQTNWKIEGIPEVLTLYRVNSGGLSANLLKKVEYWEKVVERVRSYAPELIAQSGKASRAYQLRYLARSAVRLHDGYMAVKLFNQAVAIYKGILLEEPLRTLRTGVAAYLLWFLPEPLYNQIEIFGSKLMGAVQKRRISSEESRQFA